MNDNIDRLNLLLGYLDDDPDNIALLADTASVALDAGQIDVTGRLIGRLEQLAPGNAATLPLQAMLAMREQRFTDAAYIYAQLMLIDDTPPLRFNRAWSLAMIGKKDQATLLLDDTTCTHIAAAAMLRLQLMHEREEFDQAGDYAKAMLPLHGQDEGFASAVSVLALDIEDVNLARQCVTHGGNHPDALATDGMLQLYDANPEQALERFNAALAIRQHHPRAWIGRGLAKLMRQDNAGATEDLDKGAEQFGDHIGSWLAAGWAYVTTGNAVEARARFDKAMAVDDRFAETHGSLAVLDTMNGDIDAAQRRIKTALRLDRQCFSAALAQSMLMPGDPDQARAIIEQALNTPLSASGMTIAGYMASMTTPTLH